MKKIAVTSRNAPKPIGPYSQSVMAGDLLFLSGQLPIDPRTGKLVSGDIQAQTRQIFENIAAILEQAAVEFDDVLKATIFLRDIGDFSQVNEIYALYFKEPYPARSVLEVSGLALDAQIEIELIVYAGE